METFRIQTDKFFLTYSQCAVTKEDMLEFLRIKFTTWKYAIVCEELHADGLPHLHAVIQLTSRKDVSNVRFFDYGSSPAIVYHPKVERVKSLVDAITYVKKDGRFVEDGIPTFPKTKKVALTNKELENIPILDLIDTDRLHFMAVPSLLRAREIVSSLRDDVLKIRADDFISNPWNISLPVLTSKKKHYWLWSRDPNYGKTTWLNGLAKIYRTSRFTCHEKFQTGFNVNSQFVLVDGNKKIPYDILELMCDGTYCYPIKGKSGIILNNPIIILCSNKDISTWYPNMMNIVHARFNEYDLSLTSSPFI